MNLIQNIESVYQYNVNHCDDLKSKISDSLPGSKIVQNTFIVYYFDSHVNDSSKILYSQQFKKPNIKELAFECIKANIK